MMAAVEEILSSKKKNNPCMIQFPIRRTKIVEINSYFSASYIYKYCLSDILSSVINGIWIAFFWINSQVFRAHC